ncbi:hypothetical protein HK104_005174 [Borealophlyctis nickersoniae]|nr:hypothetical protein HK104_005174 [Borealophlyctis nickersoniae]
MSFSPSPSSPPAFKAANIHPGAPLQAFKEFAERWNINGVKFNVGGPTRRTKEDLYDDLVAAFENIDLAMDRESEADLGKPFVADVSRPPQQPCLQKPPTTAYGQDNDASPFEKPPRERHAENDVESYSPSPLKKKARPRPARVPPLHQTPGTRVFEKENVPLFYENPSAEEGHRDNDFHEYRGSPYKKKARPRQQKVHVKQFPEIVDVGGALSPLSSPSCIKKSLEAARTSFRRGESLALVEQSLLDAIKNLPRDAQRPALDLLQTLRELTAVKEKGNEAVRLGNLEEALRAYNYFESIDELGGVLTAKVLSNRALVETKMKDDKAAIRSFKAAISELNKAVAVTSESPLAGFCLKLHMRLAGAYMRQGWFDDALEEYSQAQAVNAGAASSNILFNQGQCYMRLRMYASAVNALTAADNIKMGLDPAVRAALRKAERLLYREQYAEETKLPAPSQSPYAVLGLQSGAPIEAIKKAFKALALAHHPDKHATSTMDQREAAEKKFKEINEAYARLSGRA